MCRQIIDEAIQPCFSLDRGEGHPAALHVRRRRSLHEQIDLLQVLAQETKRREVVSQYTFGYRRHAIEDLPDVEHGEQCREQPFNALEPSQQIKLTRGRLQWLQEIGGPPGQRLYGGALLIV